VKNVVDGTVAPVALLHKVFVWARYVQVFRIADEVAVVVEAEGAFGEGWIFPGG